MKEIRLPMTPRSWTYLAIILGLVFHGALLPFTYGQTYDAYIHMFFGNHYMTSWFDPWETRWYTGFTVTAYPPGSHQALGLLMRVMDMRAAFIALQLLAVGLLIVGVFRFSRLWVNDRAASYAAMLCAFSTSISETLHIFGQLPTLLSIALFLNAIPHISGWIENGKKSDLALGLALTAATTSVHHVTPLFGTIFFVAPIGLAAWFSNLRQRQDLKPIGLGPTLKWMSPALLRGVAMGICMLFLIVTIVFPYWHWSITDPITQVSIPHGSRENFIAKPNLGLMFFVIPWGVLITVVPYVIFKSIKTPLWPLGLSVLIALFLGTGGTTPFPRLLLGPAFEILTLDRFTFWASILILPFAGMAVESLWDGRAKSLITQAFSPFLSRLWLVLLMVTYVSLAIFTALLPTFRPTQPDFIAPAPIVTFMDEDRHSDWRYLTLGFGDQFAYHSALINAESVDGNYHSARRLPSLMNYSVERLENSKYMGVPGLASLNQFLTNAEKFHLKYIFSNDEFYDPVLHYTGWNPITRLNNGLRVWEKPDISPLPDVRPRRDLPTYQKIMWGTLPIGSLILGFLTLLGLAASQRLISAPSRPFMSGVKKRSPLTPSSRLIGSIRALPLLVGILFLSIVITAISERNKPLPPEDVVELFYQHLDFREMEHAFDLLSKNSDLDYGQFLRIQKITGGLVPSYGKLTSVSPRAITIEKNGTAHVTSELQYLTSVGHKMVTAKDTLIKNGAGRWRIDYTPPKKQFSQSITSLKTGTRFRDLTSQPQSKTLDPIQRLARPQVEVMSAEVIEKQGRLYVIGRIKNLSEFPSCSKIIARAGSENKQKPFEQHAGRIGAHRLLPGEDGAFRVDFEGYMKIRDNPINASYDPEQFSLPEFEEIPTDVKLALSTTVCSPEYYKSLTFSDMSISSTAQGQFLNLNVSNTGTEIVSTIQVKLSYVDAQGTLKWVEPFYLQNNLTPNEIRAIQIPIKDKSGVYIGPANDVRVNGVNTNVNTASIWPMGINLDAQLDAQNGKILLDYDAMIYRPLD